METTVIPPGTVVVGVDGSRSADHALVWAVDHAVRERRPLTVAHGVDPAHAVWLDAAGAAPQGLLEALHDDGRQMLARARARVAALAPGLAVHEALWSADPRVALLGLAESAALVVVGSRGRGPVTSLLLGSVGVAVSKHAACAVVVVRPGHPGAVRHGVLVGVDASERSLATVEFAYRQASVRRLPLTILHCYEDRDAGSGEQARMEVAEAVGGLAEKFPEVRARTEVSCELAARALVRGSRRMDLVVVGAHHGGRWSTVVNGSVSAAVVEHATCPVAIVPAPQV